MYSKYYFLCLLAAIMLVISCNKGESEASSSTLFTKMPSDKTGIKFINKLDYDKDFNIYKYRNFYNGGGVAIGDINNDGLPDVYMSSNMHHNKLYLNKGNMQFEDITEKAGVAGTKSWATGVTMAMAFGGRAPISSSLSGLMKPCARIVMCWVAAFFPWPAATGGNLTTF